MAPDAHFTARLTAAIRATTMTVWPITAALATRWIRDGTADLILSTIRKECVVRQKIAARALPPGSFDTVPDGLPLWLRLPARWESSQFAASMSAAGVAVVASDAFAVSAQYTGPEAVRICVGGTADRYQIQHALELISQAMSHPPPCVTYDV